MNHAFITNNLKKHVILDKKIQNECDRIWESKNNNVSLPHEIIKINTPKH